MFSKIDNAKTQMGVSWCHVLRSCHIDNLKRVVVTSALSIELKWFFFFCNANSEGIIIYFL